MYFFTEKSLNIKYHKWDNINKYHYNENQTLSKVGDILMIVRFDGLDPINYGINASGYTAMILNMNNSLQVVESTDINQLVMNHIKKLGV